MKITMNMMMKLRIRNSLALMLLTLLLCSGITAQAGEGDQSPERILWDKTPISVHLSVGQERLVHFPSDIRYWLPDGTDAVLQGLSANGVLYLQALGPFEAVRLRVQEVDSQQLYLLDVTGTEDGHYPKEMIVLREDAVINLSQQSPPVRPKRDWIVHLTRFAAQSLYAPERLLPADAQIQRVSVNTEKPVHLVRGGELEAIPVAAWRGGGLYITAIRLRNLSQRQWVMATRHAESPQTGFVETGTIDIGTDLRGDWIAASVQHDALTKAGSDEDRTCLYLISKQPFEVSL